jgi:hypothetical protein
MIRMILFSCLLLSLHAATRGAQLFEAEDASLLLAPARIIAKDGASGGTCVALSAPEGRDTALALPFQRTEILGTVEWTIDVPAEGVFYPWVRVNWHCYCGRSFRFMYAGAGATQEANGQSHFTSTAEPGMWCWERLATMQMQAGPQHIRIMQEGHLALLDQLFLSQDPEETPPGYIPEGRRVNFGEVEQWTEQNGGLEATLEGEWGNASVAAALRLESPTDAAHAGFALALAGEQSVTEVLLQQQQETTAVVVRRRDPNGEEILLTVPVDEGFDGWHSVEARRLGLRLHLDVDGVSRGDVALFSAEPATISFLSTAPAQVEDVAVADLATHRDLLDAEDAMWAVESGSWRHASLEPGSGPLLWGQGDPAALLDVPWAVGETYALSVNVKVPEKGSAGIAFVPQGDGARHAVVVRQDGETRLAVVSLAPEGPTTLWESEALPAGPGQWCALSVRKWPGQLELGLDGGDPWRFTTGKWQEPCRPMLYAGPGAACFSDCQHAALPVFALEYLLEPSQDHLLLGHWRVVRGGAAPSGHPAFLVFTGDPETQDSRITLRRVVGPGVHIELDCRPYDGLNGLATGDDSLLPPITMPLVDSAPRFFVSATSRTSGATYTALSDAEEMRSIRLIRDGELLEEKVLPDPSPQNAWKLYLYVQNGRLEAGAQGSATVSVPLSPAETSADFDVSFGAVNVLEGEQLRARTISVAPAYPPL